MILVGDFILVKATASLFTLSFKDQKKSFVGFWFLGLLFVLKVSYP